MSGALIGVTSSEYRRVGEHHETREGEPPRREMALGVVYGEAIARAGGLPVILTPVAPAAVDAILDRLDGLCLSGGPDLHPRAYGAEPHPQLGPTEPEADAFELELARRALARGLPVLGVCRGMQVLNVAAGGTLHQHLPGHRQDVAGDRTTHRVRVARGTRLRALTGRAVLDVNSFHHQAPDRIGRGLRVSARSPDGVVEALEDPRAFFRIGVQWHAECLVDRPEHLSLFGGLVAAAARRELAAA
ncbi:MAG TPA: gamma-glutamyl-gamma-aminobutyrate hydrolase family protein [Solirubrobacteraceae bacterium]|nr:gamma-glutamyl-gamma-aminobutyrate hydrolase family protein [Solirubrobacteraceae bacterium]